LEIGIFLKQMNNKMRFNYEEQFEYQQKQLLNKIKKIIDTNDFYINQDPDWRDKITVKHISKIEMPSENENEQDLIRGYFYQTEYNYIIKKFPYLKDLLSHSERFNEHPFRMNYKSSEELIIHYDNYWKYLEITYHFIAIGQEKKYYANLQIQPENQHFFENFYKQVYFEKNFQSIQIINQLI